LARIEELEPVAANRLQLEQIRNDWLRYELTWANWHKTQEPIALAKAQGVIENATKGSLNPHFKSRYADLAAVREAIRDPLAANGLSVIQLLRTVQGGVECETVLLHASGQRISETFFMPAMKTDAHGIGSAASYCRRYSLMAMMGIAGEDDDGNAAVERPKGNGAHDINAPVTQDQVDQLQNMIIDADADLPKFLAAYGISHLSSMPATRFVEATMMLRKKIERNAVATEANE
jgi:hypothetical protein